MAQYKVKNPNIPKLNELARITKNYCVYEKLWKEEGGFQNRKNMNYWKDKLDKWHEENIEKISD